MSHKCQRCGGEIRDRKSERFCSKQCQQEFWRLHNLERDRTSKRRYWLANIEDLRAKARSYYYETKEHQLAAQKIRYQQTRLASPWRILLNAAKARAKIKGLSCDLTEEWIAARWTGRCELTGIEFVLGRPQGTPKTFTASIDRIDPKRGYEQTNCRLILHTLNLLKSDGTEEEMFLVAEALLKQRK